MSLKDYLTQTARAIAKNDELQIEFDANCKNNFFTWNQDLISSNSANNKEKIIFTTPNFTDNFAQQNYRAASDLALLYHLFSNKTIHNNFRETLAEEASLLDAFEKIRIICCCKNLYHGIVNNILQKVSQDLESLNSSIDALPLILLAKVFNQEVSSEIKDFTTQLRHHFDKKLINKIDDLSNKIHDQQTFYDAVKNIFDFLKNSHSEEKNNTSSDQDLQTKGGNFSDEKDELKKDDAQLSTDFDLQNKDFPSVDDKNQTSGASEEKLTTSKFVEAEINKEMEEIKKPVSEGKLIEFINGYKVFTNQFDQIIYPQKLVSKTELQNLRHQLDVQTSKLERISKHISLKLKRKLLSKKITQINNSTNHGILNRKNFVRLAIKPTFEDIWINNRESNYQDTAITILLDNSGSMRGNPITMSALACEIIARILEEFQIECEIIGFTTSDWKGGKSRKLWEASNKPTNPGRLNDIRHIIYKSAKQSFKKSKINLGLMLKEGLLKENIDGEALLFAKSRLMQQDKKRRIIMIISDGTPIDDSTNSTNDAEILIDHLHHVISRIEKQSKIEIVGIGIGHDVEDFYRNSISIRSLEELGDVMIEKIAQLV